jgi:hypothetical protein
MSVRRLVCAAGNLRARTVAPAISTWRSISSRAASCHQRSSCGPVTAESGVSNTVTLTMPETVGDPDEDDNSATDSDGSGLFDDGFEDSGLPD